ncbi:hypothetical protein GCM10010377_08160 [Streptomyces viridiviolaceus]|nr:hypothetical protein GCM10010377_08160 [Streptomyces viridiviolaceus]
MGTTAPESGVDHPNSAETSKQTSEAFPDETTVSVADSADPRSLRSGLFVAGTALAACLGLVLYGVLNTGENDGKPEHRTPTAAVTYEVTGQGTADIAYQGSSETGQATVVKAATLPWRKTVDVPLGKEPIVNIVLDEQGGQARCTLAVRGQHVQSATATGAFGRTTCVGQLPRQGAPGN